MHTDTSGLSVIGVPLIYLDTQTDREPSKLGHRGIMTGEVYLDIFAHDVRLVDQGMASASQ